MIDRIISEVSHLDGKLVNVNHNKCNEQNKLILLDTRRYLFWYTVQTQLMQPKNRKDNFK